MPLTPFIGLSTFIHVFIIVWHKVREYLTSQDETESVVPHRERPTSILLSLVGCAIIMSIFLFMLGSALLLIWASLHDAHSTFALAPAALALGIEEVERAPLALSLLENNFTHQGGLFDFVLSVGMVFAMFLVYFANRSVPLGEASARRTPLSFLQKRDKGSK